MPCPTASRIPPCKRFHLPKSAFSRSTERISPKKSALQSAYSYSARVQSTLKRKTSRRPDGRRLVLAEKEGFEVASQPLLRCPKKFSGFRFSSIFSTAAPTPARCIRRRRRSQALPAPFGARVQSPLTRKTSRRPDGRRLVLAEKEGFEPSRRLPDLLP